MSLRRGYESNSKGSEENGVSFRINMHPLRSESDGFEVYRTPFHSTQTLTNGSGFARHDLHYNS